MTIIAKPKLSHFGLYVGDLERMEAFYTSLFNLQVTDRGEGVVFKNKLVFLSADPSAHHQLVLASGRPPEATFSTVMQLSFKVQEIQELRRIRMEAIELGGSNMRCIDHGASLSIYFADPEGNTIEAYLDTVYYIAQPHADPLNLDLSDEEIRNENERRCRTDPSFMHAKEWQAKFPTIKSDA